MLSHPNRRQNQRGSTLILLTVALPFFLIPLVGLAIDSTMLYIVQAKLSSAVDGAALGAGRLLGTTANPTEICGEFLQANFPAGFWGSRNLRPTISATNILGTHTINVSATVEVPLLFMRMLGFRSSVVAASAVATRKDTRVVLVLDRSGSMDTTDPVSHLNVFTTMRTSAKNFVGMFTPGTDELGLVVFSTSGIVAYPTGRPYNPDPHSAGGPDTGFATSATAGPAFTQLNAMAAGGGTSMAEALTLAYIELQKAHFRDLAATGTDNTLNSIVLFSDGAPTGYTASPNSRASLPSSNVLKPSGSGSGGTTPCTYNPATTTASTVMRGSVIIPGSKPSDWQNPVGLNLLAAYDTTQNLTWWLQNPYNTSSGDYTRISNPSTAVNGCSGLGRSSTFTLVDLAKIPPTDYYGNATTGTGYTNSTISYNGTAFNANSPTSGYHNALAAWNAADNAGRTIRSQAAMPSIAIHCIGYTGNGGSDSGLLKRLANTLDSSSYVAGQESGLYVQVNSADQLSSAFTQIASELLRLAR